MKADHTPLAPEANDRRLRPFAWGVRARIVVGYVALLAAALAISVLVTRQMLLTRLDNDIQTLLAQEVEELRALAGGNDPETGEPFGNDVEAIFDTFFNRNIPNEHEAYYALVNDALVLRTFNAPDLAEDTRLVAAWAAADQPVRGTVSTSAGRTTYLAAPLSDVDGSILGTFVVAYFPGSDRAEITQIVRIILLAGATVLIVTGSLAWTLAGRVLRPARELTKTARNITESDLSLRIPVTGSDELAELGTTFNEMLDRLEAGFDGQRQFLDDVAHELRTPITIVSGHVELLGDDPGERAESQAIITDELGRMSRYVDDLLLLAKAEHGAFLRVEPFDLGEFIDSLMQRVGSIGQRRWVVDESPRLGTVVMVADEARVMQAMLNLATNAVQHTSDGDEIGIGAERSTIGDVGSIRCWVRDTGRGIDPENLDKLFRRQFRGVASRAARSEGMGLGLSIVDAIARAHGGTASARNEPNGGARFVIEIPAEPPDDIANQELP
jgi:two-component system OmpR family sensor kinase